MTFIHLPISVRSLDHFVASLVFMKGTSCCILRSNFKLSCVQWQIFWARPNGSCILWGASTDISTDTSVDISVDTSVDTRPSIGRYSIEYRSIYRSSVDRCIDRQSYRSKYLAVHRYLTDTWPIFDRYLTVTWPILDRYLTDISPMLHRYFTLVDTRPTRDR